MRISQFLFALCFVALFAHAAVGDKEAYIKKQMQEQFPQQPIKSVSKSPYFGLYEVVIGTIIVYTDEKANYVFVGNIIDAKTKQSLTEARMQEINKVNVASLPLDLAFKSVRGTGKRTLYVFSDPDCPFCKRLEKESLNGVNDVTIYTFLFPFDIHPDAARKAALIWCAKDRAQAWNDWMQNGKLPEDSGKCETPIAKVEALASKLGIRGTPGLVFADGRLVPGAIPKDKLEELLSQASK